MANDTKSSSWDPARERRRYGRFTTQLPVATCRDDLTKCNRNGQPVACRLQIQDFSLGGLRAQCTVPLKINERLTIRLPSIHRRPPTELTGRVVHCRRMRDRYQVGVEFCTTRPEASPWARVPTLFSLALEPSVSDA